MPRVFLYIGIFDLLFLIEDVSICIIADIGPWFYFYLSLLIFNTASFLKQVGRHPPLIIFLETCEELL